MKWSMKSIKDAEEKMAAYSEYKKIKKEMRDYQMAKQQ